MPVIGFLSPTLLAEAGFLEGKNVMIEYCWADDHLDRLPALAAELVNRPVAVLATGSATAAALAAKPATATIPIVFAVGGDPVKFGLVASMNRPGGNVTGVSFLANALVAKQLELLQELVPAATTIGALVNPNNPNAASDTKDVQAAATSLRRQILVVQAGSERDLEGAFANLAGQQAAALLVLPDALFIGTRRRLRRLPPAGFSKARNRPTCRCCSRSGSNW